MKKYYFIYKTTNIINEKFQDEVNYWISNGYEVLGGVAITHSSNYTDVVQSLIKKEK